MWHNTTCLPHTRSIYPLLAYAATRIPGMQGILSSICVVAFPVSLRNKQQLHLPVIFSPTSLLCVSGVPHKGLFFPVLFCRSICRQWNDENSAGADNIRGRFVCSAQVGPSWVTYSRSFHLQSQRQVGPRTKKRVRSLRRQTHPARCTKRGGKTDVRQSLFCNLSSPNADCLSRITKLRSRWSGRRRPSGRSSAAGSSS